MCVEVAVKRGDKYTICSTVGELAKALNVRQRHVSPDPYGNCLCNAYLEKLGARKATDEEGWPFPECVVEASDEMV